jgi:Ca-activated chloride channel family protein
VNAALDAFAWPLALLTLVAVPVAAWFARVEVNRRRAARVALGGPVEGTRRRDLVPIVSAALLVGAIALAALAFARPRWGAQEVPLEQRGIDVVVVLDISRSMLAEDLAPSRAKASASAVSELLTHLQGNRVGLITFAGSSFSRAPLTLDIETVQTLVNGAQNESSLVRPGSDLGGAVLAALTLLDVSDRAITQVILVVTDGEVQDADITAVAGAANKAKAQGVRVFGAYAASDQPAALPLSSGGTDVSRGQRTPLIALSEQTGAQLRDVAQVPGYAVEFRRLQQSRFAEASRLATVERFQWFAAAALLLLVAQFLLPRAAARQPSRGTGRGFRRSRAARAAALTSMVAAMVLLSGCTTLLGTQVYRAVAEGNRLYHEGKYDEALAAYDRALAADPKSAGIAYNRGLALNRLTRYDEAYRETLAAINEATDPALVAQMEYAAGNSAMLLERWDDARLRYISALRINAGDADTKANLEMALTRSGRGPNSMPGDDGSDPPGSNGEQNQPQPDQQGPGSPPPGQQPGQQPDQQGPQQPNSGQPGQQGPQQPNQQPGDATDAGDAAVPTQAEAQAALEAALAALGPEVTREQALRILQLAQQANALTRPSRPGTPNGPPPPR